MNRRGLFVVLLALTFVLMSISAASALHDAQPIEWRDGDTVGDCRYGIKTGNYVRSVQTILWSDLLIAKDDRDGIWGPQTEGATRTWQSQHGLGVDGCVGYNTWNKMQNGSHRVCPPGVGECYTLPHFSYTGSSTWRWREPKSDSAHYSYYMENFCWFVRIYGVYRPIVRSGNSCVVH